MSVKKCSKCGVAFECCNEKRGCWCENYHVAAQTLIKLQEQYTNCLCESCLQAYSDGKKAIKTGEVPINS